MTGIIENVNAPTAPNRMKWDGSKWLGLILLSSVMSPIALVWVAIKCPSETIKRVAITVFCAVYALTMKLIDTSDGTRHLDRVDQYYINMGAGQFLAELGQIFQLEGTRAGISDPYVHTISFLAGGIFQQPLVFFALAGLVFGWFFSGAILIALRYMAWNKINYAFGFIIALALFMRGIQDIQAVRMWTGGWMVLYGSLSYCIDRNRRSLVSIAMAPAVHFTFLAISPVVLVAIVFRRRRKAVSWVFLATAVFSFNFQPATMVDFESAGILESRSAYVKDENNSTSAFSEFASAAKTTSLHNAATRAGIPKIGYTLFGSVLLLCGFMRGLPQQAKDVLFVSIAILAFSNLSFGIPALSGRTTLIGANALLLAYIYARTSTIRRSFTTTRIEARLFKYGSNGAFLFMSPMLVFAVSYLTHHFSMYMFAFPFYPIINPDTNISIKEFVFLKFL